MSIWHIPNKPTVATLEWFKNNLRYDEVNGGILDLNGNALGWNSQGYWRWSKWNVRYLVHHIVWFLCKNEWPSFPLDHKDRNKSNNKIDNLRVGTSIINMRNRSAAKKNVTGYKGVMLQRNGKFRATIGHNKKLHYIGQFNTAEEAYAARLEVENKLWTS